MDTRRWNLKTWFIVAVLVVVVASLLVLAVFYLPAKIVQATEVHHVSKRLELQNAVRMTLIQAIGGLVLIVGALFTWRTIQVNKQGQITERYTRAIDQLGSDKPDVRVGGIFALERIARESDTDRDSIRDVLTAFVRERRSLASQPSPRPVKIAYSGYVDPEARLPPDVQAALTVIGRRDRSKEGEEVHVDLSGVDLRGADLRRAHLERAWLVNTFLAGAHLEEAHLEDALLYGAVLTASRLERTHLEHTRLDNVRFDGARLIGTYLQRATVHGVVFDRELMHDCHLDGLVGSAKFRSVDEDFGDSQPLTEDRPLEDS